MLAFYDIDQCYVDYLRTFDPQVPRISYETNNKFVCGIVLSINGYDYFAPISSKTIKQKTSLQILDKHSSAIASIKFSFMIPVPPKSLVRKDFSKIAIADPAYADLLRTEYAFCKKKETEIKNKALKIYAIGCNPSHVLNHTCCKFKLLEEKCSEYICTVCK